MRISVVLIIVVTAVNVIGRPHNDGTDHTHSPVIAPDSESVINIEGHNEAAVHHSDVGLGNHSSSSKTDMSLIVAASKEIAAADTHHSDTHLNPVQATSKPQPVGAGHAPILHVDHAGKKGDHLMPEGKLGSVVSHGPIAKNVDNHEVKHNHDHDHEHGRHGHHDKHSTIHHAPMATEHHPKGGNAHHPQLSKTEPANGHAPLAHPDQHHKQDSTDDTINEDTEVSSPVNHPPLATDHHAQRIVLAHHPSLSKSDTPLAHSPFAIPHSNGKSGESSLRQKRSGPGGQTRGTHPKTPPRESIEEYQDSDEYPSKEDEDQKVRSRRSKNNNQKSYARKTTTTTTTTSVAPPTESQTSDATERVSSEQQVSEGTTLEGSIGNRDKRSKGSNQKTNVRKTLTTTTTTTAAPAPTASKVLEASHRGSSEEQDSREQSNKKPEEIEFREKRSKGSNRKPAAYTRTTITSTETPKTTHSDSTTDSHEHGNDEGEPKVPVVRRKRSKGSNQKSYARKTTTTTTTTTVAPTTLDSSDPTSIEYSEEPESHGHDSSEEAVARSKRSKGSNHSFPKKPLTTHNYPTAASTSSSASVSEEATESNIAVSSNVPGEQEVRVKRSKGSYQKTQPRKTTTTTTTAKPTSAATTSDVSEAVSVDSSESIILDEVTSEKTVRDKRSKGSNQNSYKKHQTTTTTVAPKVQEPEIPASNVHHPSLSKTEPLNPAKPEEPKTTKPDAGTQAAVPEIVTKSQPPQIIPGSHPLAIPLPTNPPAA